MNANNSLGDFLNGRPFVPRPPVNTNSQALDVSVPSNYERLVSFYKEAPAVMRNMVFPASAGDDLTLKTMEFAWKNYNLHIDSNTAVALAAVQQAAHKLDSSAHVIVLATGHPAKAADLVYKTTGRNVNVPESLLILQKKTDPIAIIPPQIEAFEGAIASCI
jgi:threonine synthase